MSDYNICFDTLRFPGEIHKLNEKKYIGLKEYKEMNGFERSFNLRKPEYQPFDHYLFEDYKHALCNNCGKYIVEYFKIEYRRGREEDDDGDECNCIIYTSKKENREFLKKHKKLGWLGCCIICLMVHRITEETKRKIRADKLACIRLLRARRLELKKNRIPINLEVNFEDIKPLRWGTEIFYRGIRV